MTSVYLNEEWNIPVSQIIRNNQKNPDIDYVLFVVKISEKCAAFKKVLQYFLHFGGK